MSESDLALHGGTPVRESLLPYGKQTISNEDVDAVVECLGAAYLTTGPRVEMFEQNICKYTGAKYAVACCNGTAALHLAVFAANIQKGDEVIVSSITFAASSNAVLYQGGTVVFADVDERTLNIDVSKVESLITERTKAIIAVDMMARQVVMEIVLLIS